MTDDERFDEALRHAYEVRDPGLAPLRLRTRVAAIPSTEPASRSWLGTLVGVARPALAATMTAAALLIGILIVSIARPAGTSPVGPGSSTPPGGASPGPELATVSVPLGLSVGWTVLAALVALVVAWVAVELRVGLQSGIGSAPVRLRTRRARGLFFVVLAVPVLILGQVIRYDASLAQGGFFEASLVHLEGMGTIQGSAAGPERQAAYFRLTSGGTVTFVQAVRNDGRFPITVTGVTGAEPGLELRLWAVHDPSGPIDVDTMPNYPFAPFQLMPGSEREIVGIIHLAPCPGIVVPSPEPSPVLSGTYQPAGPYTSENFDSLGLTYSVLGFAREVDVPLFATVAVGSASGSVCGTDPSWTIPAPSVLMP